VTTGLTLWRRDRGRAAVPTRIEWSTDGTRLVVLSPRSLRVYDRRGRLIERDGRSNGDAAFRPGTTELQLVQLRGSQSAVVPSRGRRGFSGTGVFQDLAWAPTGRWYLVTWQTADQWVFVRGRRIRAVSNVSEQFRSRSFPRVEGWCCG
jgi:hypothetical protein